METKLSIMEKFFEDPNKEFHIRELSRILKINHTTIRQHLNKLVKDGLLVLTKDKVYSSYRVVISGEYLNLKLYHNLEKLRESRIIEDLQRYYDFPVIVLFGSYAKSVDDMGSDIDLCVISNIKKEFDSEKYKDFLKRDIEIHHFTKNKWENLKGGNPELINSICNGIVLSGELEVL